MRFPLKTNTRLYYHDRFQTAWELFSVCIPYAYDPENPITKASFPAGQQREIPPLSKSEEEKAKQALILFFQEYRKVTPTRVFHLVQIEKSGYFDYMPYICLMKISLEKGKYHSACMYLEDLVRNFIIFEARIHVALMDLYKQYL